MSPFPNNALYTNMVKFASGVDQGINVICLCFQNTSLFTDDSLCKCITYIMN
jgi:hypothetical protein